MLAFITVGSTRFDSLVKCVFSLPVLSSLRDRGYTRLIIQCGDSEFEHAHLLEQGDAAFHLEKEGISIDCWRYKPTLQREFEAADLVISHAGSGTILDVLRLDKPLIVVPNPTLLDNHQEELAIALQDLGHLKASTPSTLAADIQSLDITSLVKFPPFDGSRFRKILDEEMGFT